MIRMLSRHPNNVLELGPLLDVVVQDSDSLAMVELRLTIVFLKRQLMLFDSLNLELDSLMMFRSQ